MRLSSRSPPPLFELFPSGPAAGFGESWLIFIIEPTKNRMSVSDVTVHDGDATHNNQTESSFAKAPAHFTWKRAHRPHRAAHFVRAGVQQGSCNQVAERISMRSSNGLALKVRAARTPRPAPESLASRARRPAHSQLHSRRRAIEHAPALRARCPMTALDRPCTRPPIQCPPRPPRALRTW